MQDPSQLSDAELLAIIGVQAPQAPQAPQQAPRQAAPARPAPAALTGVQAQIESLLPGVRITSGRRDLERNRSVGGAPNSYHLRGQAFDLAPPPGMSMADLERQLRASGLPFAELLNEGDHVHVAWNGEAVDAPSTPQPRQPGSPQPVVDMSDAELMALAEGQGISVQENVGMPPEWFIANGLPLNATTEDMLAAGFVPDPEKPGFWMKGDPRSAGHVQALEQEREQLASSEAPSYAKPDFLDQTTAPINDELAWLAGLGSQAVGNIGRTLTGQDVEVSALDRARAMRDLSREGQDQFEQDKPLQALGGGILGGFAFAPARAAALPGLAGRLGQAGAVSSAYGAAEGDGYGGRAGSAAVSGLVGLGTAGTLETAAPVARGLLGGAERMRAPRGSLPNASERRVGGALQSALERDNTPASEIITNMGLGRKPFAAGGENLLGLAETMAQAPGQARAMLVNTAKEVQDGATNRVTQQLSDQFGADGNFYVTLRDRVSQQRDVAKQGMAEIGDTPLNLSPDAQAAIRSDRARSAILEAAENRRSSIDPDVRAQGDRLAALLDDGNVNVGGMTVRDAQEVSYALNDAASSAFANGDGARGRTLSELGRAVRQNARDQSPEYGAWLQRYGDDAEANDALRVGKNLFAESNERNAMSVPELRERWSDWSDLAKENFRLGVGEAVLGRVRRGGGIPALRRVLKDQDVAERIGLAFGDEAGFARFMEFATNETTLQGQLNQILGNSPSVRRAAGRVDLEAQGLDPLDMVEAAADFTNPVGMGRQALRLAAKTLPRRDRSILGNEELNGLIGRALTDETEMTRLLNLAQTDRAIGERVSRQLRGLGLLSAPGVPASGQQRARGLLTANP